MMNFRKRSYQKELIDLNNIPFHEIARNLKELDFINKHLGGHSITICGVKNLRDQTEPLTVCEIGCGGGDNLFAVYNWCKKKKINAAFIGIDMKQECIEFAKQRYPGLPCRWICSDYRLVEFNEEKPAIIYSSLFCHHFTDEELVSMLRWQQQNSKLGFFINDLQRHKLAHFLIKWLAKFFSRSPLLKNDAPLSVARGFKRREWILLMNKAGLKHFTIAWKWAFRWLLIAHAQRLKNGIQTE
jgi:2-polyprenyl-3-methyl-5-hydroxy-6-metoxy-1,4-benzoquinol methylase